MAAKRDLVLFTWDAASRRSRRTGVGTARPSKEGFHRPRDIYLRKIAVDMLAYVPDKYTAS